jgi:hypothetical protein
MSTRRINSPIINKTTMRDTTDISAADEAFSE